MATLNAGQLPVIACSTIANARQGQDKKHSPLFSSLFLEKSAKRYLPTASFTSILHDFSVAYPGYLRSIIDPFFGYEIIRLSNSSVRGVSFPYIKTPSLNCDGSLLRMLSIKFQNGRWYLPITEQTWRKDNKQKWSTVFSGSDYVSCSNTTGNSLLGAEITATPGGEKYYETFCREVLE